MPGMRDLCWYRPQISVFQLYIYIYAIRGRNCANTNQSHLFLIITPKCVHWVWSRLSDLSSTYCSETTNLNHFRPLSGPMHGRVGTRTDGQVSPSLLRLREQWYIFVYCRQWRMRDRWPSSELFICLGYRTNATVVCNTCLEIPAQFRVRHAHVYSL